MDTFSPAVLAPWLCFWQVGLAQALVAPFTGKRWDKLLPITRFPGEALLGPSCTCCFLPDLYQPPEPMSLATGVERLNLKVQVKVKKAVQEPRAAV